MVRFRCSSEICVEMFKNLSDKTRQRIILLFMDKKEYNVEDISKKFKLSRPTISHHLNKMRRIKILNSRKDGKEIFYSFNKDYTTSSIKSFLDDIKRCY